MLLELCVTELEDVASDKQAVCGVVQPVVQESPHPYTDDMSLAGTARIPGTFILSLSSAGCAGHFHICSTYQ